MEWWAFLAAYVAGGSVFTGWALMVLDDKHQTLASNSFTMIVLWPLLLLILVGAWLGRKS